MCEMPVRIFEGSRGRPPGDEIVRRNLERRFFALAAAVRDHEAAARRGAPRTQPHDESLYRRLREICGDSVSAERSRVSA
jgi:hypothetical protein